MLLIDFHCLFNLPALPDTSGRIVRRTKNCRMDLVLHNFFFHIFVINPPDSFFIQHQWIQNDVPSIVLNTMCKSDIRRRLQQNRIPIGTQYFQSRNHTAEHTVLIADALFCQIVHAITCLLPVDDPVIICLRRIKITVCRMLCPLDDRLRNCRKRREIHIRYPHRDQIKPFPNFRTCEKIIACIVSGRRIYCDGILSPPVHNRCKIILHDIKPLFLKSGSPQKGKDVPNWRHPSIRVQRILLFLLF